MDATMVSPAGKGHARTQRHAVEALARLGELELVAFVRDAEAAALLPVETVVVAERPSILWEQAGLPLRARGLDALLSWSDRLSVFPQPPTVVWLFESPVHRIRQNRRAAAGAYQRGADLLTGALWRRSLRRAAHVCFGSQATAAEILADAPGLEGQTSVVYPGLAPEFSPGPGPERAPYVLHLGSSDPRDNTKVARDAASLADVELVVVGEAGIGRASDAELVDLYRGASAYLDPTLYEGFGYGVLEAMACGAPVVASDRTSIPEIVGDAGLLCDPTSPEELAAALRRIFDEPGLAEDLRRRGLERAREFSWEAAARTLLATLRRAALGD